jgi:hypothetical protein
MHEIDILSVYELTCHWALRCHPERLSALPSTLQSIVFIALSCITATRAGKIPCGYLPNRIRVLAAA